MPFMYEIIKKEKLVMTSGKGNIKYNDIVLLWQNLSKDLSFEPDYNHFIVFDKETQFNLTIYEIKQLESKQPFSRNSMRALVTISDNIFGSHRVYEAYQEMSGYKFRVFRDKNAAVHWLDKIKLLPNKLISVQ